MLKLCQPEEIVIIQVRGERVLSENRLEGKRQSDQRKKEVKSVKRVKKNAQERTLKYPEYSERNGKEN